MVLSVQQPSGQSVASAAVVSALFLLFVPLAVVNLRITKFRVYMLLTMSCLFRGVGYALRAASISNFDVAEIAASYALAAAGLGMVIAVHSFNVSCWFKNADDYARPPAKISMLAHKFGIALVPCVIIFGPILGIVAAVLLYGGNPDVYDSALRIRNATMLGLTCVLGLITLLTLWASISGLMGVARARKAGTHQRRVLRDHNLLIVLLLPCCLFLGVSMADKVASAYGHPQMQSNEDIAYSMTVLPELLDLCVLLFPKLMARAGLAQKYGEHTAAVRGHKEQQQQRTQKEQQGQANGANRVTVMQHNGGSHRNVEHGRGTSLIG